MSEAAFLSDEDRRQAVLQALQMPAGVEEPALQALVRTAGRVTGAPLALLSVVGIEQVWCLASQGEGSREVPRADSLCVHALRDAGDIHEVADLDQWGAGRARHPQAAGRWRAYAGAPYVVDGVRLGTVCVFREHPGVLDAHARATLVDLARLAGELLQARLQARRWRLQEARVRTAGRAGSDWFWETDDENRLTWISEHVDQHLGVPAAADLGRRLEELVEPAPDEAASWDAYRQAVRARQPYRDALMQRHTARGTVVLSVNGVPVHDSTGRFRGYRGASRDVTEQMRDRMRQRRAEELLRETRAGMAAVLRALPDLWFTFDTKDRYQEYGAPNDVLLVQPFSELAGRTPYDVLPAACAGPIVAAMQATRRTGVPREIEYELTTSDGEARIFEARFSAMPAGRVLMIVRDVTEVRTLARRLLVMQRAIEADGSLPIVVCDASRPELPLVYTSPAFERLTGYGREESIGRSCNFLQGADREQRDLPRLREALREGRPCRAELTNYRRDGTAFVNELHVAPVHDARGRLTHFIGVLNDVTERRESERRLSISEERWSFALENSGDGVWDWDAVTDKVFYSKRWKTMLGHEEDEVGDGVHEWTSRIHPEDFEHVMRTIWQHLAGDSPNYVCEHRVRCKDGSYRWILDRGRVVQRLPDGQALRMIGTHTDITELRAAQRALRDKQAAELANRAKTEFLSRMSHEMRTPLNALLGFAQLLWGPVAQEPERVKAYASHLVAAGQHLLALIDDVLDLQRVEAGQLALTLEAVPVCQEVRQTLELLAPMAHGRGVQCEGDIDPGLVVRADRLRLRQVLMNIVSNAIKYNREGGRVRLTAVPGPRPGRVCIAIEDTGVGMRPEDLPRLFQPFERLGRETSGVSGTGLGLVIAKRMTEEMSGSLAVHSEPGVGTRMEVHLPVSDARAPEEPAGVPVRTDVVGRAGTVPARVLYVEDNEVNAMLFEAVLARRADIELRIVANGAQALAVLDDWVPDVVVLDANLPGLSGMAVYQALRAHARHRATPVFMCSAEAGQAEVQRALEAGFAGYWIKPIDVQRVLDDIDGVLASRPPSAP